MQIKTSKAVRFRQQQKRLTLVVFQLNLYKVTPPVLQSTPLDLIDTGKGLKFQAERPHLVSLGSGRLSTAITLLPLPEGEAAV